jgi:hypothetical protein
MATTLIMSDYLENALVNHMFRNIPYSPTGAVYLALYTTDPTDTDVGTEVPETTGGPMGPSTGYTRIQCPAFTITDGLASVGQLSFSEAMASGWGRVYYIGIRDALTGGNLLFHGNLSERLDVLTYNTVRVSPTIRLLGGANYGWGAGTANAILDFVLNGVSFSPPGLTVYLALGRSIILDNYNNCTGWTEITAGGYARQRVIDWGVDGHGVISNNSVVTFTDNALANWGTVSNLAFFNSSSSPDIGNMLVWGRLTTTRIVYLGDGFRFPIGSISISIDS